MSSRTRLAEAAAYFHEHGYVLLPGYLTADELAPAQGELTLMFPSPEDYHGGVDPERNARFAGSAFAGIDQFPYDSVEWTLLGLSDPVLTLAEALLGSPDFRLYEAHNWAKYGGATEYDQQLHRDFGNHTVVVPSDSPAFGEVEMFIYVHDVPDDCGPTGVVSQQHTAHLPIVPSFITRDDHPDVYAEEVLAAGPAGSVLAYKTSTFHRGTSIRNPLGSRFFVKASYRAVSDVWIDRLALVNRLGPAWYRFVERATPRQLELTGFPPRGHAYWTEQTWSDTCLRYPDADLTAFRPATVAD